VKRKAHLLGALAAALLAGGVAVAQSVMVIRDWDGSALLDVYTDGDTAPASPRGILLMGTDGTNIRAVSVNSSGAVATGGAHGACTNGSVTVGTSPTNIPASPRANRSFITFHLETSGATIECEFDGSDVTTGSGLVLEHRTIFSISLAGTVNVSCQCSTTGCSVRYMECP